VPRKPIGRFFLGRQQIGQDGCQPLLLQDTRDELVPRAVPSAAAAVGKNHRPLRFVRHREERMQRPAAIQRDLHIDW
jgi:hypothetical protein